MQTRLPGGTIQDRLERALSRITLQTRQVLYFCQHLTFAPEILVSSPGARPLRITLQTNQVL